MHTHEDSICNADRETGRQKRSVRAFNLHTVRYTYIFKEHAWRGDGHLLYDAVFSSSVFLIAQVDTGTHTWPPVITAWAPHPEEGGDAGHGNRVAPETLSDAAIPRNAGDKVR